VRNRETEMTNNHDMYVGVRNYAHGDLSHTHTHTHTHSDLEIFLFFLQIDARFSVAFERVWDHR